LELIPEQIEQAKISQDLCDSENDSSSAKAIAPGILAYCLSFIVEMS